jgi:hypothetical protein
VKTEAAGLKGFVEPDGADDEQYRKVVSHAYQKSWFKKYGSVGSHICSMRSKFAKEYVAMVWLTGQPPPDAVDADVAAAGPVLGKVSSQGPATRPAGAGQPVMP